MKDPHDEIVPALAQRHGRQRGARIYIPEAALKQAFTRDGGDITYDVPEPLYYRVRPWGKKTVLVRFGAEDEM